MDCQDLEIIKNDIEKFIKQLELKSKNKVIFTDDEKSFLRFLAKHILFFKELYRFDKSKYFLEVLISDIFSYIISIIDGEKRYIFLNERSIIENYIRYLMKENHIKENTFYKLKEKFKLENDVFSLLKEEYSTSCKYIHGGEILKTELLFYFFEFLKKEKEISEFANPKRLKESVKRERKLKNISENGIWIGTQVVEASLDLDFDILITELSDLNGLFQRMGRCYRNREVLDEKYNCYVFTEECSGIKGSKAVIDKEIHNKSKEALLEVDGLLTEQKKLELIEEVYSTESLKNTEYYGKLVKDIYALKNYIVEYEKTKSEVQRIFRNIASKDVIPKIIYQENEEEIEKNIEILKKKAKGLDEEERKDLRSEKIEARREINQFKVAIPEYEFDNISLEKVKKIEINDYETLIILDCDYSYDKGAEVLKEERNKDSEDSFF